jgi:leucyl-tRNA synthetase
MRDCGHLSLDEPFAGLFTQGMINHLTFRSESGEWLEPGKVKRLDDGRWVTVDTGAPVIPGRVEKMSKSKLNTIDPTEIIEGYGADTARFFMLSDSPPERDLEWTEGGIDGAWRYLNRLWRLVDTALPALAQSGPDDPALRRLVHRTIDQVTASIERFHFNKAVALVRELSNAVEVRLAEGPIDGTLLREALETVVRLLNPMIPHLTEEL